MFAVYRIKIGNDFHRFPFGGSRRGVNDRQLWRCNDPARGRVPTVLNVLIIVMRFGHLRFTYIPNYLLCLSFFLAVLAWYVLTSRKPTV